MKSFLYRPAKLRGLTFLAMLLLALAILSGMIWRNLHHLDLVLFYVNYSHRIQNVSMRLQQSLIEVDAVSPVVDLKKTMAEMDALRVDNHYLSENSRKSLQTINNLLADVHTLDKADKNTRLIAALKVMIETLDREALQREKVLEEISKDTETDLYIALATLTLILLVAILFLQRRILHPLNDLRRLLQRLAEENFTPFTTEHLDPLVLPVFHSYNEMVKHLAELKEVKRLHEQSLQYEVRLATQALLEQQYSLARAERLAAIGEVAAELAHEIRNPLAGIQMAFANFRREISDPQQCERLTMINAELKRLALLLNDMLDQSRHSPELASDFDVVVLIHDLVSLTRYQLPESVAIKIQTPSSLQLHLPESMLRQTLLNLLLNAADALEAHCGTIEIHVYQTAQHLLIDVSDDGIGFSQEMLNYGIRPFRSSRQRGTGLGLAMVQRSIKNMGGSIKLRNQQPHGACVTLQLPKECLTHTL